MKQFCCILLPKELLGVKYDGVNGKISIVNYALVLFMKPLGHKMLPNCVDKCAGHILRPFMKSTAGKRMQVNLCKWKVWEEVENIMEDEEGRRRARREGHK